MSKATYWQRGETLDYMNTATSAIEAGTVIALGSRIGVAAADIPAGELGEVNVDGVYKMPKAANAIALGAVLAWDTETGKADTATKDSTLIAGYAVATAAATDTEVLVKINA